MFRVYSMILFFSMCLVQISCFEKEVVLSIPEINSLPISHENLVGSWVFNAKCINLNEDLTYTLDFEGSVNISSKGVWGIKPDNTSSQIIGSIIFDSEPEGIENKYLSVLKLSKSQLFLLVEVEHSNDIGSNIFKSIEQRAYQRK